MERIVGVETKYGIIQGRDGIYLDSISNPKENELILKGEFNLGEDFKKYEIIFTGIVFLKSIELDFDERGPLESFGIIDNSDLIQKFQKMNHSAKLNSNHKHYYFRTYDTTFEIVAEYYELKI